MLKLKHFSTIEFDSPDQKGSGKLMNEAFLAKLDQMRDLAGIPFKISSGYRTPKHNAAVGGVAGSSHMKGHAADISVRTSAQRHAVLRAAVTIGFKRIGIANTFIHVDDDPSLPEEVVWLYGK